MVVDVKVSTMFPFGENVTFDFDTTAAFNFSVRVPRWCKRARILLSARRVDRGGLAAGMQTVEVPMGKSELILMLPMHVRIEHRAPYRL